MELTNEQLARLLGWRQLATYFLDGFNPKCGKHPVMLQAILEYEDCLSEGNMRYSAHAFVTAAYEIIERDGAYEAQVNALDAYHVEWLNKWREKHFPKLKFL